MIKPAYELGEQASRMFAFIERWNGPKMWNIWIGRWCFTIGAHRATYEYALSTRRRRAYQRQFK